MRQAGEPTVEEILESIKKVIARDNANGDDGLERRAPTASAETEDDSATADAEILDLAETAEFIDADKAAAIADDGGNVEIESPLLTASTQASMHESLAALAILSEPGAQPQIVRSGETSLEGMIRDLLRPALAEWLDKNLPPLVERMVAAEIKRIVGKKG